MQTNEEYKNKKFREFLNKALFSYYFIAKARKSILHNFFINLFSIFILYFCLMIILLEHFFYIFYFWLLILPKRLALIVILIFVYCNILLKLMPTQYSLKVKYHFLIVYLSSRVYYFVFILFSIRDGSDLKAHCNLDLRDWFILQIF